MSAIDELLVRCCAPTLAGIKTGSLFSCAYDGRDELLGEVRRLNGCLSPRGLCLAPLRFGAQRALLYLFRPAELARDLSCAHAREILAEAGYEGCRLSACLRCLSLRLQSGEEFPHEVGLFLSYPPEDVRGFIDNKARNYKLCGHWKVYGDEEQARRTFERYNKCAKAYSRFFRAGFGIEQLAVANE